jgi:hypothetical protein
MLLLQGDRPQSSGLPQAEAAVKQVVSYPALAAVRKGQPAGIDYADYPLPPDLAVTVDPLGITQTAVMTFSGKIGRCDATILMDSGASYNFIAHDFITKHHITTTAAFDGPTIRVADPADLDTKARAELGFLWQLEQPWQVPPHPRIGGGGYPVWLTGRAGPSHFSIILKPRFSMNSRFMYT